MSNATSRIIRPDAVDISCRLPVLALALGALAWLLGGLLLSLGASVTLHEPGLGACPYLGPGKLAAAARVALTYGFALPAALALGIWILFRGADTPIRTGIAVAAGAGVWNLGVVSGVIGILAGETSGLRGFDFPRYTGGILLAAYLLIGLAVLPVFGRTRRLPLQLSQMMVVAALLWMPWLLSTAQVLLAWYPVRGVLSEVTTAWYAHALFWGCLAPVTLAVVLQIRRDVLGSELPRPEYAHLGFWSLLALAGWSGASALVGGPVPAWISSIGVVAGVLLVIPVVLLALNLFAGGVLNGGGHPSVWLATSSGLAFLLGGVLTSATSLRCANRILRFTQFPTALSEGMFFGFVTLGLLAGLYLILPRLIGYAWDRPILSVVHVGLSVAGVGLMIVASLVGGWLQGQQVDQPSISLEVVNAGLLKYLRLHSVGVVLLLAAQGAFVLQVVLLGGRHLPALKQFVMGLIQVEGLGSKEVARAAK